MSRTMTAWCRACLCAVALLPLLATTSCKSFLGSGDFAFWRSNSVQGVRNFAEESRRSLRSRPGSIRKLLDLQPTDGASAKELLPSESRRLGSFFDTMQRLSYREQAR